MTYLVRRRCRRSLSALALGLLLGGFLPGCGDGSTGDSTAPVSSTPPPAATPAAATPAPPVTTPAPFTPVAGGARIEFASLTHDFGIITDSQKYRTSYRFRNIGDQTLRINDIKAACGCTVPALAKRQYLPGEEGEIDVVFDPKGKKEKTEKTLTVMSNSVGSPTTELRFTSMIQPLLSSERLERLNNIPLGTDHRHLVSVYYRDPGLAIKSVSVNDDNIHATVLSSGDVHETSEDGVVYRADIEVLVSRDVPWGMLYAKKLTIDVSGRWRPDAAPIDFTYDVFLMGTVHGEIQARPGLISLGAVPPGGSYGKSVQLQRSTGSPFNILEAKIVESTLRDTTVRVNASGPAGYTVTVEGNAGNHRGSIRGFVSLATDVPGEEVLRILFSGQVR